MPEAIVIAGANGAGKTTFARQFLPVLFPRVPFLNVDEIHKEDPAFAHPVAAGRELLHRLDEAEFHRVSFAVETTLSSKMYVPESDVRRRFHRGLALFQQVYKPLVDEWYHWYSDDGGMNLVQQGRR